MPVFFYSTQDPAAAGAAAAIRKRLGGEAFNMQGFPAWRFDRVSGSEARSAGGVGGKGDAGQLSGGSCADASGKGASAGRRGLPAFDLVELPFSALEAQVVDSFGADLAVFLSRHASSSAKKCFTTHVTGNWGPAEHGGSPNTLSAASAFWLKRFYLSLKEAVGSEACFEATHHGPTLETPVVFVEIGSTADEWVKEGNAEILAAAALAGLKRKDGGKVALGFGGTHYCAAFEPLVGQGYAFSHIASKHSLDFVSKGMVAQAVAKTVEPVEKCFIDWKGCNKAQRDSLIGWFGELGLEWERV